MTRNPLDILTEVRDSCLFDDDDGQIGVTTEPYISYQLFDEICEVVNDSKIDIETNKALVFEYMNWRGETSVRRVTPLSIRYGSNEYHTETQWLLLAFCHDKVENREFAMQDMKGIS